MHRSGCTKPAESVDCAFFLLLYSTCTAGPPYASLTRSMELRGFSFICLSAFGAALPFTEALRTITLASVLDSFRSLLGLPTPKQFGSVLEFGVTRGCLLSSLERDEVFLWIVSSSVCYSCLLRKQASVLQPAAALFMILASSRRSSAMLALGTGCSSPLSAASAASCTLHWLACAYLEQGAMARSPAFQRWHCTARCSHLLHE